MIKKTCLWLAGAFFLVIFGFAGESAMAQYTGELIFCLDGSSSEACRETEISPNEDGVVVWGRDYGDIMCVGAGIVPQDIDCFFTGASFGGFDCQTRPFTHRVTVPAGSDMAIACGTIAPLSNGEYSASATSSSCFKDQSVCGNFILTDIALSDPRDKD